VHTLVATMPSVAGFSSANINFALNAPAVGATLPLQIDGGLVNGPVLGSTTGVAPAAGRVGESVHYANTNTLTVTTSSGMQTINAAQGSLSAGVWMLIPYLNAKENGAYGGAVRVGCKVSSSPSDAISIGPNTVPGECVNTYGAFSAGLSGTFSGIPLVVVLLSATTFYCRLTSFDNVTSGSLGFRAGFLAVRIA